jgi:hypothetical protein
MFQYDLFISHTTLHAEDARKIKLQAEKKGLKVFLAELSLKPGVDWEDEIRQALIDSRELAVLATPDIKGSEWVTSEWSAGWLLKKPITAILLGHGRQDLPPRLLKHQSADYEHVSSFLDEIAKNKQQGRSSDIDLLSYYQIKYPGMVEETLVAPVIKSSPFVFDELFPTTQKHIFIAGQNLYSLVVRLGDVNKPRIFKFLGQDSSRKVEILVCDPSFRGAIETWIEVTASPKYERDLKEALEVLEVWTQEAKESNLNFEAKTTPFVPVSATFVDPDSQDGRLFLTPNIFEPSATDRACFLLYRRLHDKTFNTYWENYKLTFLRGSPIGKVK